MFCKYCGSEVSDHARFCPDCGKRLEKVVVLKDASENASSQTWPHDFDEQQAKPVSTTPVATAEPLAAEKEEDPRAQAACSELDAITQDRAQRQNPPASSYPGPMYQQAPPSNPYYPQAMQNPYLYPQPRKERAGCAIASLVLGLVSVFMWLFPFFGFPTTIIGLIMGILGRNSQYRGMSVAGIVLSVVFLVFTLGWAVLTFLAMMGSFNSGYPYYYY